MANFKLVISDPKDKKAYQVEVDQKASALVGRKIGDTFDGGIAGLHGYKLQITGGSDQQGFPMRKDVEGQGRKKILLAFGPGFHPRIEGQRKRKYIHGNTISLDIAQLNAKIAEYGKEAAAKLLGKEAKEEKKAEEKAETKKEAKSAEKAGAAPEAGKAAEKRAGEVTEEKKHASGKAAEKPKERPEGSDKAAMDARPETAEKPKAEAKPEKPAEKKAKEGSGEKK